MEKNVGGTDRTARIILGLFTVAGLIAVGLFGGNLGTLVQAGIMVVLLILAVIFLGTAASQKCMMNDLAGRDTYKRGGSGE